MQRHLKIIRTAFNVTVPNAPFYDTLPTTIAGVLLVNTPTIKFYKNHLHSQEELILLNYINGN